MLHTSFYKQHQTSGAKMMAFAGVQMPLHYKMGILKEHEWVRTRAGLFDVSHMRQCQLSGQGAAQTLNLLTPSHVQDLKANQAKYTVFTTPEGGIVDDLIITRIGEDAFHLVVNASRAKADIKWLRTHLKPKTTLNLYPELMPLLALQGPYAAEALSTLLPSKIDLSQLAFMHGIQTTLMGAEIQITRTGYTGEDGFELSIQGDEVTAQHIWIALCQHEDVSPIGLGARDSLRLEVGFPLYGQDINETTSPVEAGLSWLIHKENKKFLGHDRILSERKNGPKRKRIGVEITEKGVARQGAILLTPEGEKIGTLTSGGFSPTLKKAIGQGYVNADYADTGKIILVQVRNRRLRARIHELNFIRSQPKKPSA